VETFIAGDQLVGESEAGHEAALLEPVDGAEGAGEEDTLDASEGDQTLSEGGLVVDPLEGPVGLLRDHGDSLNGVEQEILLLGVLDVGVDEEGVGLGVDVLHGDLETVEGAGLGDLDLVGELHGQILVDNAVRCGEEREHHLDEMLFLVIEILPVGEIGGEVDFLGGPEGSLLLFVLFPDLGVLDGEDDKSVGVLDENLFRLLEADLLSAVKNHFARNFVYLFSYGIRWLFVVVCLCCFYCTDVYKKL